MTQVQGKDLQVGDIMSVWWNPNKAEILEIRNFYSSLNEELWDGKAKIVKFPKGTHTKGTIEMTIEPEAYYEVSNR